jgi:2-C-methyl-D-erythritol 4-phosphate cytidylyltransferase/2-C-methyl-D-erythritol 2,4-cyclodiphosphate synthase
MLPIFIIGASYNKKLMKNLALIVAGGSGSRFGGQIPKQYQLLQGKQVLAHTVQAFTNHPDISGVMVVISPEHEQYYNLDVPFCHGGKERQDSVRLGLIALEKLKPENVLIHDAARPFVSHQVISNVLAGLKNHEAVIPVISAKDSVRLDGTAVDRNKLQIVQTPQGFNFKKILHAHQHNSSHWVKLTDDAQVAEVSGMNLFFVEGDEMNRKITTQQDLGANSSPRIGMGFDVHQFEAGDGVIICGVKIAHDKKLKGHSDADVGLHAITDAILGAIGAGDIGDHFPPSDTRWKNADSAQFLKHAASLVNGEINNIDVTIICEEPKITPHKKAMKERIAEILNISADRVSVKATTTEGLGFTGRREGIAAQAVASINVIG